MHRFRQFLSDVFIIDNNIVILRSVDIKSQSLLKTITFTA